MLVPGTRRLCRVGLAAVLVTALCALAFVDLPPQLPEPSYEPPPTLGGEPPGTRSVVAYSWARRLALDYRPSSECPWTGNISEKEFPLPSPSTKWLETLNRRLFLFSAHLDRRLPSYQNVRVIAVRSKPIEDLLYCTIWYEDDKSLRSVSMEAITSDIWLEQWGGIPDTYSGVLITCPLSKSQNIFRPLSVTVSSTTCSSDPSHSLEISAIRLSENKDNFSLSIPKRQFTLCIKGLDFDKDISLKVAAFVELHRILGAGKFYFYVFNVHENVMKVLRLFESSNVVRWINLTLPGDLPNGVQARRKFLQEQVWLKRRMELIPYNHCFYENLEDSEYVVPIDLDETIIPNGGKNWRELFRREKKRLGKYFDEFASYAVRNTYFFHEIQQRGQRRDNQDLVIQGIRYLDTARTSFISPEGDSVKSFISTKRALTVHNHYALATINSGIRRAHHFLVNDVLKHHHRKCKGIQQLDCNTLMQDIVYDKSASFYANDLIVRINFVRENLTL